MNGACVKCDSITDSIGSQYCEQCPDLVVLSVNVGVYKICARPCVAGKTLSYSEEAAKTSCLDCSVEEDIDAQYLPTGYKCTCPGVRYLDGDLCKLCPPDTSGLTAEQQAECGGASP